MIMLRYNDILRGELYVKPHGRAPAVRRGGSLRIEPTDSDLLREEIQAHRRCESLKIPRTKHGTPERKSSFKRPSLVPEVEPDDEDDDDDGDANTQSCVWTSSCYRAPERKISFSKRLNIPEKGFEVDHTSCAQSYGHHRTLERKMSLKRPSFLPGINAAEQQQQQQQHLMCSCAPNSFLAQERKLSFVASNFVEDSAEVQKTRICTSLQHGTPERALFANDQATGIQSENADTCACILSHGNDQSPYRVFKRSPSHRYSETFTQIELSRQANRQQDKTTQVENGIFEEMNVGDKNVAFTDTLDSEAVFNFKRHPKRSSSLKVGLFGTRQEPKIDIRPRSKSFKSDLLKYVHSNDSQFLTENLPLRKDSLKLDSSVLKHSNTKQPRARSPRASRNSRHRCNSAPTNEDIMNYLINIDARISLMDRRLDWLSYMDEKISTGDCATEMTKEVVRESDKGERKMSVPKICHEIEGEILNIPENKLLQRRRMMHGDSQLSPNSVPHGRSCSFRNRPRPKLLNVDIDRPRRSSLPSPSANLLSVSFDDIRGNKENSEPLRRVRSFKTTSKGGVINRGDSFKRSSHSVNSTGSAVVSESGNSGSRQRINSTNSKDSGTAESTSSSAPLPTVYKVAILGDKGVGKTSLTNQFMTSEFVAFENDVDEEDKDRHVTVLLNSEESTLEFVDRPMDNTELSYQNFDAFGVVFSITDRATFQTAVDQLYTIRHELDRTDKPTILIANKIDLVRKRKVAREEGRAVAKQYDCKYTETSAALNHHVDELLVGFLSQIRLKMTPGITMEPPSFATHAKSGKQVMSGPKKFLHKLFKKNMGKTSLHECENLFSE